MKLAYEEFDLSGVRALSAGVAAEQGAARGLRARRTRRAAAWPRGWRACRSCSPRGDLRAPSSRRSPRRTRAGRAGRLGARRARHQDRPVADPHRPDGARLRVGAGAERRRRHPRRRDRAGRRDLRGRRRGARARAASAWPRRPAPASTSAIARRRRPRAGAWARRWPRGSPAAGAAARRRQPALRRGAPRRFRSPCTSPSAPTSSTCTRTRRARRSARAACATSATSRRRWRGSGGGVYLNCGSAVVLPEVFLKAVAVARNQGHDLDGPDHRRPRLPPARTGPQTNVVQAADRRHRAGHPPHRPPRDPDSAARGRGRERTPPGLDVLTARADPSGRRGASLVIKSTGSCRSSSAG